VDIVADGSRLYQLHRTGRIWLYTGSPNWLELDRNSDTVKIAAGGGDLFQLHRTGKIWKYTGTPETGWLGIDESGESFDMVADLRGALYQLRRNGEVLAFTAGGWLLFDNNADTKALAARDGRVYQIHKTGKIWKYTAPPITGWLQLDANPTSLDIAAGDQALIKSVKPARFCRIQYRRRAKEWLLHGAIPEHDTRLETDAVGPGYHINTAGKLVLESKDDMQRRGIASPDDFDALALTFAQRVAPKPIVVLVSVPQF
jgi:hypothetical protein